MGALASRETSSSGQRCPQYGLQPLRRALSALASLHLVRRFSANRSMGAEEPPQNRRSVSEGSILLGADSLPRAQFVCTRTGYLALQESGRVRRRTRTLCGFWSLAEPLHHGGACSLGSLGMLFCDGRPGYGSHCGLGIMSGWERVGMR